MSSRIKCRECGAESYNDNNTRIICPHCFDSICARLEAAEKLLKIFGDKQPNAMGIIKSNNFNFDNLDDRWQKLAFTFYTDLVEIKQEVEAYRDCFDIPAPERKEDGHE